jgi:hypothetical protein
MRTTGGVMSRRQVSEGDLRRVFEAEVSGRWSGARWIRWLDAASVLQGQSFRNAVLIRLHLPAAMWVGRRDARGLVGRQVVRGDPDRQCLAVALGDNGAAERWRWVPAPSQLRERLQNSGHWCVLTRVLQRRASLRSRLSEGSLEVVFVQLEPGFEGLQVRVQLSYGVEVRLPVNSSWFSA